MPQRTKGHRGCTPPAGSAHKKVDLSGLLPNSDMRFHSQSYAAEIPMPVRVFPAGTNISSPRFVCPMPSPIYWRGALVKTPPDAPEGVI
jgi:hypothetical protein